MKNITLLLAFVYMVSTSLQAQTRDVESLKCDLRAAGRTIDSAPAPVFMKTFKVKIPTQTSQIIFKDFSTLSDANFPFKGLVEVILQKLVNEPDHHIGLRYTTYNSVGLEPNEHMLTGVLYQSSQNEFRFFNVISQKDSITDVREIYIECKKTVR